MKYITVDQLAQMCLSMSAQRHGSKAVLMSSDDECNEYHQASEGLRLGSELKGIIDQYQIRSCGVEDLSDCVVLT